jgi:hypothetical protein
MLGLHLIHSDKPLVKCRREGECRSCGVRRIVDVELVGGGDALGSIPLCAHCEDEWRRDELNIGGLLKPAEAAFVVKAMGFREAHRFLMPRDYHRAIEAARADVEEAA